MTKSCSTWKMCEKFEIGKKKRKTVGFSLQLYHTRLQWSVLPAKPPPNSRSLKAVIKWLWHCGDEKPSRGAIVDCFNRREKQQKDNEPHFPILWLSTFQWSLLLCSVTVNYCMRSCETPLKASPESWGSTLYCFHRCFVSYGQSLQRPQMRREFMRCQSWTSKQYKRKAINLVSLVTAIWRTSLQVK